MTNTSIEANNLVLSTDEWTIPPDLQRVARGDATLAESFQILAQRKEEQLQNEADLREREAWAVEALLFRCGAIWDLLADTTLRFRLDCPGSPVKYHLELGRHDHLSALSAPSPGEQALIAATMPCWARVYPHHERQRAGETGVLANSYVPITTAEAVATLGLGTIVSTLEAASRAAGVALLSLTQEQLQREERLVRVERMLGCRPDPSAGSGNRAIDLRTRLALALLALGGHDRLMLGAVFAGLPVILLGLLFDIPHLLLALMLAGMAVLICYRLRAA